MEVEINKDAFLEYFGIDKKFYNKKHYIILCHDFYYFPKEVHIIGCTGNAIDEEICYYIDVEDCNGNNLEYYRSELERFKTIKDAKKYCDYLNNLKENKKRRILYEKYTLYDERRIGRGID